VFRRCELPASGRTPNTYHPSLPPPLRSSDGSGLFAEEVAHWGKATTTTRQRDDDDVNVNVYVAIPRPRLAVGAMRYAPYTSMLAHHVTICDICNIFAPSSNQNYFIHYHYTTNHKNS
jgi:hypothetical protein